MNDIYLLYNCNRHKEWSSMRLVMATKSLRKLKQEFKHQVKSESMNYNSYDSKEYKNTEGVKALKKELNTKTANQINDLLEYGYIDTVEDGERQ